MLFLTFTALIFGWLTMALLWNEGVVLAILAAPFGGSAATLVAGGLLAIWRRGRHHQQADLAPTDDPYVGPVARSV